MKTALFGYNFPHKKTQDFLFYLNASGLSPDLVILADWVALPTNETTVLLRTKLRHTALFQPKELCESLNIKHIVARHNSLEAEAALKEHDIQLGIIAGARILKENIINAVKKGIVNFHPGMIPTARGLDALQWSIYDNLPLGVTAHFIDKRIDAGYIIEKKVIKEYPDDTLLDLSLRLYEAQLEMLVPTVHKALNIDLTEFEYVTAQNKSNTKMPAELEEQIAYLLSKRLKR